MEICSWRSHIWSNTFQAKSMFQKFGIRINENNYIKFCQIESLFRKQLQIEIQFYGDFLIFQQLTDHGLKHKPHQVVLPVAVSVSRDEKAHDLPRVRLP